MAAAACVRPAPPFDVRANAAADGRGVEVRVVVHAEHREYAARFLAGALETIRAIENAHGSYGPGPVVLIDGDWNGRADAPGGAVVMEPVRWWTTRTAMAPELAAARAVSRRFWTGVLKTQRLPSWFPDALSELTARRATAELFGRDNLTPGYTFTEARYFGGFVPLFVRIRVRVETGGAANDAYRANPHVDMTSALRTEQDRAAQIGKAILTFGTLERWVGAPAADDIVRRFVARLRERPADLDEFERLASEDTGQDLSWLFASVFRSTGTFDYAIDPLDSTRDGDAYVATVTARRPGDAVFSGSSGAPDGPFERGRGIALQTTFADGQARVDYWDGRAPSKTFRYRSPAPIASAIVDPDRLVLLDLERTHNGAERHPSSASATTTWALHYTVWLEHVLLTWVALA